MKLLIGDTRVILDASQSLNLLAKKVCSLGDKETAEMLFQRAAELELASPELQNCWGGPFNGQSGREAIVTDLLRILSPSAVVETGTFRGITAEWFATHFSGPIFTCEKERLYLLQAEARLSRFPTVRLRFLDTRPFLRECLPGLSRKRPVLIYLDAHWEFDLPLREELQIIFSSRRDAVVIIDDFKLPDDPGYGWDFYSSDKSLEPKILENVIPSDSTIFFPVLRSDQETGAVRGCCVIARETAGKVAESTLLRGASLEHWIQLESDLGATLHETSTDENAPQLSSTSEWNANNELSRNSVSALIREVEKLRSEAALSEQIRRKHLDAFYTLDAEIMRLRATRTSGWPESLAKLRRGIRSLLWEPWTS